MVLLVAPVAVLAVAGGIAYALIPDGKGVVHGCYMRWGGNLRVIDNSVSSCRAGEVPLAWGVTGPPGPEGPQGPAGPATAAFATDGGLDPIGLPEATPTRVSRTLSLPPGSYVLSGKVEVYEEAGNEVQVTCQLRNDGISSAPSSLDFSDARLFAGSSSANSPGSLATLPLVGSVSFTEGSLAMSIVCTSTGNAHAQFANLYAVQVASLERQ
jgi:hypothetical protein